MCGIVGRISADAQGGALDLDAIRHRGPDDRGQQQVGSALLGFTRLSIIDLGGGAQPMTSADGGATIVFNGEIYNYRELRGELDARGFAFVTNSDTEVILGAYLTWGVEGLARLRGMYSLALADRRSGETVLARDPFGIKPLFYHEGAGRVLFASETAALIGLLDGVPEIDRTSVLETLFHRYPIGDHTLYKGIKRLEPGVAMIVSPAGQVRRKQFASLTEAVERERKAGNRHDPGAVRERVADTVAHHAIADVPLGCFLSGGLDSSIVAWQLAQIASEPVRAYSVSFASTASERSELPYARSVAEQIGAELIEVSVSGVDFADLAPRLSGTLNGPFPDPADVAMLKMSLAAAQDVKVVLSGEGADEAFAGYPKYAFDRYARFVPPGLSKVLPLAKLGRAGIALEALGESDRTHRWMCWFQNADVPQGLLESLIADGAAPARAANWVRDRVASYPADWSDLQRMQVLDLEAWLPNNLLHRGDYTTMQASLEQRVPFLDKNFTPWAIALPDRAKLQRWRGKHALRQAFAGRLPPAVLARPKSGFRLPLGEWLTTPGPLHAMLNDLLLDPNARLRGLMDRSELHGVVSPSQLASTRGAKLAWTVLSLELWLRSLP